MTSKEIREAFFKFFQNKEHQLVPSAPIVVKDDPTLMFTNAGMNQFKDVFLGNKVAKNSRVVDTQKCLRVSGKHNDLEEVGVDTYHHTMFEMLGNWSFGDFFKDEMIPWAWEFLTEEIGLAKDRLYVTIFEGDEEDGLGEDTDAYNAWAKILPAEKILKAGKKDNFWEMGEVGPCGPCSEIHMDIRDEEDRQKVDGATLVNQDHPQVVEIWNLVFMEFNRTKDKSLKPLPNKHVDTGMGFERLCMAIQGVKSNYDTDVFKPSINHLDKIANKKYTASQSKTDIAFRVIADHIRAIAFSIADGQLPSNTGAGYVIRRILRRAVRYGYSFLDLKEPFLYKMLIPLKATLGETFDELNSQHQLIEKVILEEEQSFLRTLEKGIQRFESYCEENPKIIKGGFAFELYDTFGFPIDLTNLLAEEKGLKVDMPAFESELKQQKERSREATKVDTGDWVEVFKDDKEEFIGYDQTSAKVKISRYRKVKQKNKELFQLVFNLTPFYPEGGGQVGDTGYIEFNGEKVSILDTKKENLLIVHFVEELPTNLEAEFHAQVNESKRRKTAANHSATHLLHQALREVLGNHVEQKGSMVHSGIFRFDFSHYSKVTSEELNAVEQFVNARIKEQIPLEENRNVPYDQAISDGAIALFGEKYGDIVRTIRFGQSIELCGGTHVENTLDIWHFKITTETAVAAGIRRIEAITGEAALEYFEDQNQLLLQVNELLKNPQDMSKAVIQLQAENVGLKKELNELKKQKIQILAQEAQTEIQDRNGIAFLAKVVDLDAQSAKDLAFTLGKDCDNLFLVLGSAKGDKPMLSCYISKKLVSEKGMNAKIVVRELGQYIQGGGGGQPFFATAGGKNSAGIDKALKAAIDLIPS